LPCGQLAAGEIGLIRIYLYFPRRRREPGPEAASFLKLNNFTLALETPSLERDRS
jgi:hypothetical protein